MHGRAPAVAPISPRSLPAGTRLLFDECPRFGGGSRRSRRSAWPGRDPISCFPAPKGTPVSEQRGRAAAPSPARLRRGGAGKRRRAVSASSSWSCCSAQRVSAVQQGWWGRGVAVQTDLKDRRGFACFRGLNPQPFGSTKYLSFLLHQD